MILVLKIPLPPHGCSPNSAGHENFQLTGIANAWMRDRAKTIAAVNKPKGWTHQKIRISSVWYMGPTPEEIAIKAADAANGGKGKGRVKGVARSWAVKYRPIDSSNAGSAMKPAIDGLVDAGLVPKDNHRWVAVAPPILYRQKKEHKGLAYIELTIQQVEGLF